MNTLLYLTLEDPGSGGLIKPRKLQYMRRIDPVIGLSSHNTVIGLKLKFIHRNLQIVRGTTPRDGDGRSPIPPPPTGEKY